jgi:nucleoside phosphorylase
LVARFNKPTGRNFLTRLVKAIELSLPDREADIDRLVRILRGASPAAPASPNPTTVGDDDNTPTDYEKQPWYPSSLPATDQVSYKQAMALQPKIDVVLMTATDLELRAALRLLKPYPRRKHILRVYIGPETYYLGMFGKYRSIVTKCEMGAVGSGSTVLAAEQALRLWEPRAAIMVGIAFGADRMKQRMGDLLVAQQLSVYEIARVGAHATIYRGPRPESDPTLRNRFKNPQNWRFERPDGSRCDIHYGQVLTGEKLMDNPEEKAELLAVAPEAIGGEMEGAGLWSAAERLKVPWILVKAICDWGDGTKIGKHQPLAAAAAADLVHHILSQKNVLSGLYKRTDADQATG